jgi:signal transduction histidine kinase
MRRRTALTVLVAVGVTLLLGWYVVYTQRVLSELRAEARQSSRVAARVFAGQTDPADDASDLALSDLAAMIRESGVPLIVTNSAGVPTDTANLPPSVHGSAAAVGAYIAELDAENAPVTEATLGVTVHYGSTDLVHGLSVIPFLQASLLALLVIAGIVLLLTHGRAERERMWAGMARESAHQIGTPLSSLHGWMEVLLDRAGDPLVDSAIGHMRGDIERLERVAHRFERIGRPPKKESVDVSAAVERVVVYFRSRVPTLATPVQILVDVHDDGLTVLGDRVLIEWVLESLIKNAIDALSATGGTITVSAEAQPGGRVRIRVADDGPGVPANLRKRIFDAGFSTKERGWGIGLALTRRIVEENHGGKLALAPAPKGAAFDVILPA